MVWEEAKVRAMVAALANFMKMHGNAFFPLMECGCPFLVFERRGKARQARLKIATELPC